MSGRSFRKAVNEKCKDCIYDPAWVGTWRQQVQLCTVKSCPLYALRPVSEANTDEELLKMVEKYAVK